MTEYGDIYLMRSKGDGIPYVGVSIDFDGRKSKHFSQINIKKHSNFKINIYINRNNKNSEDFEFILLEKSVSLSNISEREVYWIRYFDSFENGFNATIGGDYKTKLRGKYHPRSKPITYDGVYYNSMTECANTLGIKVGTIYYRIRNNITETKNLNKSKNINKYNKKRVVYNNICFYSIVDCAKFFDVKESCMGYRIKNNISSDEILILQKEKRKNKAKRVSIGDDIYNSIKIASSELFVTKKTIHTWLKTGKAQYID